MSELDTVSASVAVALPDGDKLREIIRLLDEAFEHYQECPDAGWKSSENHVSVGLGNYWQRNQEHAPPTVSVYSYALGPGRVHDFATVDEALAAVRGWHADEMAHMDHEDCL